MTLTLDVHRRSAAGVSSNFLASLRQTSLAQHILQILVGDYAIYRVFRLELEGLSAPRLEAHEQRGYQFTPVHAPTVAASAHPEIRARAKYGGSEALGFAVMFQDQVVCLQWFWHGKRYKLRNFWPLTEREAKSVDLFTVPYYRGQGLATALKQYSAYQMKQQGFRNLYSRIWHSNRASIRVNEKSGWKQIALVAEFYPFGRKTKVRMVRRFTG